MRSLSHSLVVVGVAFLLVGAAISGPGQQTIEDTTGVETVGEAEAVAPLALAAGGVAVIEGGQLICDHYCPTDDDTEKIEEADAEQEMIDIFSSGQATHDASEVYLTEVENYISDSKEVALMIGKNAAIREYMNGSSDIQSEQAARSAIQDYYSQRQVALTQTWNTTVTHWGYLSDVAQNETNLSNSKQEPSYEDDPYLDASATGGSGSVKLHWFEEVGNDSIELANGTTIPVKTAKMAAGESQGDVGTYAGYVDIRPDMGTSSATSTMNEQTYTFTSLDINAQQIDGGDYDEFKYLVFDEYKNRWDQIDDVEADATDEVVTFVNSTHDEWEAGSINESELIDPYLGSREYGPDGDFQSWALSTYSSLGLGSPANLTNFGSMTITEDNETVEGILMSDGLPESGTFETGVTYNTSELAGYQYVIGPSQSWELEGEFTIESMRDSEGNNQTSVEYRDVTYESANLSEYQAISDDLADLRAEIEATKQDHLNGGGGGFGGGTSLMLIGGVLALLGVLMAARSQ